MVVRAALVLVDWDSARRVSNIKSGPRNEANFLYKIDSAIERLQEEIAKFLNDIQTKDITRVSWRIYHGWHDGETATEDRRHFEKFISRYRSRAIGRTSFGADFVFGDEIMCNSIRSPLRYTHRKKLSRNIGDIEYQQKMVDTAIVSDLLHATRTRAFDRIIVIGDDDDLLPGLFTAEQWGACLNFVRINNSSKLPLLRGRENGFPVSNIIARGV